MEKASGKTFGIKEVNKDKVEKLKKERDVLMEKHVLMRAHSLPLQNFSQCNRIFWLFYQRGSVLS